LSVYRQQNTEMTNLDSLQQALKEQPLRSKKKCEPVVHKEAQALEGYQGDKRKQKAHIIIPRDQVGGSSNDIGFEKGADGKIVAHISDFDKSHYNAKWLAKLKGDYVRIEGRRIARQKGLVYKGEQKLPNGKTRLTFVPA
jgi:Txe/YoeB family toxin of Txe-Axe toxin-antitoxin module